MNKPIIIILAMALSFSFGCKRSSKNGIIGTWKSITLAGDNSSTTYLEDGTVIEKGSMPDGPEWEFQGTWKILNDGKIQHYYSDALVTNTTTFAYSINGDIMTRHFDFKRID